MNKYRVVVDGTAYVVEVEDLGAAASTMSTSPAPTAVSAPAAVPAPVSPAAPVVSAPVAASAQKTAATANAGSVSINAPMPGKVLEVKVSVGSSVKSGDLVLLLEAMKMENEIFAPADGVVADIRVKSGDSVNTDDVLITLS